MPGDVWQIQWWAATDQVFGPENRGVSALMIIDYLATGLSGFDPEEFPEAHDFTVELTIWGEDRGRSRSTWPTSFRRPRS